MSVSALDFGTTRQGQPTHLFRMTNASGMQVDVTDLGASIVSVRVPDAQGRLVDVALGYDDVARYEDNRVALGGIVGRCCNRIAGASFTLEGRTFHLTANEGANTLHGGRDMWFERLWDGALIGRRGRRRKGADADTVTFGLFSPDGDQGFPGEVDARVTYQLTDDNELVLTYDAQPGVETIINLTNHTYWNLDGHDAGDVRGHTLQVFAETYTPTDDELIPIGIEESVEGTPLDFREPKTLMAAYEQGLSGLDHNFVVSHGRRQSHHAARLSAAHSGITLDVFSEFCALQVYDGGILDGLAGKDGVTYGAYAGIALETQFCPDAIHHPAFEQPVCTPDHPFTRRTVLKFGLA